tara:strand:+ start:1682 stop:2296 length:615 start_codon:yes stop_codon:yes gene_type:complete
MVVNRSAKFRFQKKYAAFLTVVPLLIITSLVQIDDPVTNGTGVLASAEGMENVRLANSQSYMQYAMSDICDAYFVYKYDITLSLVNDGPDEAQGWVKLILRDFTKGTVMDIQYISVEIPGLTPIDVTYPVWFTTAPMVARASEVHAELASGDIPYGDGSGKTSLNSWLLVNAFKNKFQEKARLVGEFKPPIYYSPDTEAGGYRE